jgi:RNA polymerase sigma-70 factor (TIGR02943 family)
MSTLEPKYWVDRYADYLLRYAMFRLNDQLQCEDLVQETFLSALKAKEQFKGNSSEKTWLTSILKNKIIDAYRKKERRPEAVSDEVFYSQFFDINDEQSTHWRSDQYPHLWEGSAVEGMITKEYYRILHQCVSNLTETQQAILTEKYFEETTSEKICKDFNISKSNYWTIIHRVNIQLRKCLELNWANK